jgi:hypothetical protein
MASFRPLRINLDQARSSHRYAESGHYFQVTDASNPNIVIGVQVNQPTNRKHNMRKGEGWINDAYSEFYLTHNAYPGEWIEISLGGDPQEASRPLFQRYTEDALASVNVSNVNPIAVASTLSEFRPADEEARVWALHLNSQNLTQTLLNQLNPAALGGQRVPEGFELVLWSVSGGANDTAGGLLRILDGDGQLRAMTPLTNPVQLVDWQGMIVPPGSQFFLNRLSDASTYSVTASVSGFLRGLGSGPAVVVPDPPEDPVAEDGGDSGGAGGGGTGGGGTGGKLPPSSKPPRTDLNPSADSRIIYVAADGSDSNDGLSMGSPVLTLEHAYSLVRAGYPDWVLLKRGDTFELPDGTDGNFRWMNKDGRSAAEPIVYGAYGNAADPRPIINTMGRCFLRNSYADYTTFIDLDIYANNRDPLHDDFEAFTHSVDVGAWIKRAHDVRFENCRFSWFTTGIVMQDTGNDDPATIYNVAVHNCYFYQSYSEGSGDAHGVFGASVGKTDITNCVFEHIGWINDGPSADRPSRNHAVYFEGSSDITVDGCAFYMTSYEDVKFRNEDGADPCQNLVITNNAFIYAQYAMGFDTNNGDGLGQPIVYDGVRVENNVFTRTTGESNGAGGPTMRIGWMRNGLFENNLFTDPAPTNQAPQAIECKINTPLDNVRVIHNTSTLGYPNPFYEFAGGGGDNSGLTLADNLVYNTSLSLEVLLGSQTVPQFLRTSNNPAASIIAHYRATRRR